jgi:hypothetical protein
MVDLAAVVTVPVILLSPTAVNSQTLPALEGVVVLLSLIYALSFIFRYLTLNAFGQQYQGFVGASPRGVASVAKLAEVELGAGKHIGLDNLERSMEMANTYLASKGIRLKRANELLATL